MSADQDKPGSPAPDEGDSKPPTVLTQEEQPACPMETETPAVTKPEVIEPKEEGEEPKPTAQEPVGGESSDTGVAEAADTSPTKAPDGLFQGWKYFVSGTAQEKVISALNSAGAIQKSYLSSACTHCIVGDDADVDGEVTEANEIHEIPAIKQEYVLDAVSQDALPSIKGYAVSTSKIFSRCVFSVTGLEKPDRLALWAFISFHGGKFSPELKSGVTHLVCASNKFNGTKFAEAVKKEIYLVTPDFVVESVKKKALVDPILFHPKLLLKPGERPRKIRKKKPQTITPPEPPKDNTATRETAEKVPSLSVTETLNQNLLTPSDVPPSTRPSTSAAATTVAKSEVAEAPLSTTSTTSVQATIPAVSVAATVSITPVITQPSVKPEAHGGPTLTCSSSATPGTTSSQTPPKSSPVVTPRMPTMPNFRLPQTPVSVTPEMLAEQSANAPSTVSTASTMLQQIQGPQPMIPLQQQGNQTGVPPHSQLQTASPSIPPPQQHWQLQAKTQGSQWNQQPQQLRPVLPGWQQQQTRVPQQLAPGQMHIMTRARHHTPHMLRQQQVLEQHLTTLTPEEKHNFTQMSSREKQQYLANRGLLLPQPPHGPGQVPVIRQTLTLNDQQREMLQTMDGPQRQLFLQKIQKEQRDLQMRQQMIQQQQQQQPQQAQAPQESVGSQQGGSQQQPTPSQQTVAQPGQTHMPPPSQMQWQPGQQGQPPYGGQVSPQIVRAPHTSPNAQIVSSANGGGQPPVLNQQQQQMRPAWTGETHPALAQVPRTPQQLQHLQRLQMQREQQQPSMDTNGGIMGVARPPMSAPPHQQQLLIQTHSQAPQQSQSLQQHQQQQQQFAVGSGVQMVSVNGSNQKTKAALASMLNSRLQPQPMQAPVTMATDGSGPNRMPVMNQISHQHVPPSAMPQHLVQPQGQVMYPQQRPSMVVPHRMEIVGGVQYPAAMGSPRVCSGPQRMGSPLQRSPMGINPPFPKAQFHGHDPTTRLPPPDLCLLGCIFHFTDYQTDDELSIYVSDWKKMIQQYGGEVEEEYQPRVTHLLCKTQDSQVCQQALKEGKRLVTVHWLNDVLVKKKVTPPTKAVHFPLPPNFHPPCEHFLLTITGFEGRDRDWVKDMIKWIGAKYTGCFSKYNHAIICRSATGIKYQKAKEWKIPAVSVEWLNDVIFGNVVADQSLSLVKYQKFDHDNPLRIEYDLVHHLMVAWKVPIKVTTETFDRFRANLPARIKRKAERQRLERDAKRLKEAEQTAGTEHSTTLQTPQSQQNTSANQSDQQGLQNHNQQPSREIAKTISNGSQDKATGEPQRLTNESDKANQPVAENIADKGNAPNNAGKEQNQQADGAPDVKPIWSQGNLANAVEPHIKQEPVESVGQKKNEDEKENVTDGLDVPKIIFSGFVESELSTLHQCARELGGKVLSRDEARSVTHIVMPKMGKTTTLLCALPFAKFILHKSWISDSKTARQFLAEGNYHLDCESFEHRNKCSLRKLLTSPNRKRLFHGMTFYLTPNIQPHWKEMKAIIEYSGGVVDVTRMKTVQQIRNVNKRTTQATYVIITCLKDIYMVEHVLSARIPVFNTHFVISSVLKGFVDFDMKCLTTI